MKLFTRAKKHKTVLFISPTGDFSNGAECSVFQLMKFLAATGHRVFNAYPAYSLFAEDVYRTAMQEADITPIRVDSLRWWPDAPGGDINTPADAPADLDAIRILRQIIRENAVDIVITNTVNIYHGAIAAAEENAAHFWLIHEYPQDEFTYYYNKIGFISAYSDALFCVEGALQSTLEPLLDMRKSGAFKKSESKIGTFLPYTNVEKLEERKAESFDLAQKQPHRIVCVGLLTEKKNQIELLRAYAKLPHELKDTPLLFIGGYSENDSYWHLCNNFVASNSLQNVSFAGYLENPWNYVSNQDIVVLPSKSETFGCVYTESLLCGIPVMAADNPGFTTINKLFNAGKLYPCGNVDALSQAIKEMLQNFNAEKAKAEAAAPRVCSAFTPQNAFAQLVKRIEATKKPRRKHGYDATRLNELLVKTAR